MGKLGRVLLAACLLAGLLTGCGAPPMASERAETLALEFAPREGGDPMEQLHALTALEAILPELLAQYGAEGKTVTLTLGTTPAATAQALREGGVDAAFLPAEGWESVQETADRICGAAYPGTALTSEDPLDWLGQENTWSEPEAGQRMLLLAGPSEYGRNLASRLQAGKPLTWEELSRGTWGRSGQENERAVSDWLAEQGKGRTLDALPNSVEAESPEALLAHLAAEDIDLAVLPADVRIDAAGTWSGASPGGWGRPGSIWEETTVLAVTGPYYELAAAVCRESPWGEDKTLRTALASALVDLAAEHPEMQALIGEQSLVELS